MIFRTLYFDEIRGFARSKVMIALWVGLPLLALIIKLASPNTEGLSLLTFVAIMVGSIGGTLSSVLLSTAITSERTRHVYDLFLVRPVGRGVLLISKFFAAFTCLLGAALLSIALAFVVDAASGNVTPGLWAELAGSFLISLAAMTIGSAVGVLFGVLVSSVAVSAILSVYLGNQLSAVIVLPAVLVEGLNVELFAAAVGLFVPAAILLVAIAVFRRKSL